MLAERGPREWDGDHSGPPVRRLEKEYAAMKSKEMEEQIEIKVSPQGGGAQRQDALGTRPCPGHKPESEASSLRPPVPSSSSRAHPAAGDPSQGW